MDRNTVSPTEEDVRALRLKRLEQQRPSPNDGPGKESDSLKNSNILKDLERILVFDICDEKHNSPQALLDHSIRPLIKILSNIRDHPSEDKYRKLRYNNQFVRKSIIDTPNERLLRLVGWSSDTQNFEKFLIFTHQEGSREWAILCIAIERLEAIEKKEAGRIGTLHQRQEEKKELLENTRKNIRQDEEERHSRFQY